MAWNMGVWIVGLLSVAAFLVAFQFSGLVKRVQIAVGVARETAAVITNRNLDDDEKESRVQRGAIRLFGQFLVITLVSIVVLAVPGMVMMVGELIGVASFEAVSDFLLSWEIIVGITLIVLAAVWWVKRR